MKTAREFAMEIIDRHFNSTSASDLVELSELIEAREKELKAPGPCPQKHPKIFWVEGVGAPFTNRDAYCQICTEQAEFRVETAKLQAEIAELKARNETLIKVQDGEIEEYKAEIAELKDRHENAMATLSLSYQSGREYAELIMARAEIAELNRKVFKDYLK
jgi:FtsZ-binding cell division protein ZapB